MQKFCAENLRNSISFALTAAGVYDLELLKLQVLYYTLLQTAEMFAYVFSYR